jgi:hypothetical protein
MSQVYFARHSKLRKVKIGITSRSLSSRLQWLEAVVGKGMRLIGSIQNADLKRSYESPEVRN